MWPGRRGCIDLGLQNSSTSVVALAIRIIGFQPQTRGNLRPPMSSLQSSNMLSCPYPMDSRSPLLPSPSTLVCDAVRWEEVRVDRRWLSPVLLQEPRLAPFVCPSFWLCVVEPPFFSFPSRSRGRFLPLRLGSPSLQSFSLNDKGHRPRTTSGSDIWEATVNSLETPSTMISALSSIRMW